VRLVLAGRPKQGEGRVRELIAARKLSAVVAVPGFVPDELLAALYAEARALVFPSLYEGFGLPALEAQAAGVPVVASNITSLPELLGSGAIYVNPESAQDISRGLEAVLEDADLRAELAAAGRQSARRFTWIETARQHVAVYERLH